MAQPPGMRPPMGPPPPRRSSGSTTCLIVAIVVIVAFLGLVGMGMLFFRQAAPMPTTWAGTTGDTVGVIRVTGIIETGGDAAGLFGAAAGSETITSQIRRASKDSSVKALIIRINSPGGSAAASQEIYQAIREYQKDTKRPVIASMADVAASGGYYVAAACDHIVAAPATLTGSIGVIMETMSYYKLMDKLGVSMDPVTSGKYKDMGSPFRAMRPDERQLMQAMVNDVYDQFVDAVAAGRKMDKAEVKRLATGRVFTGRQALEAKLVDSNGTFRDAITLAARKAGIKGEPTVKFFERVSVLSTLFGEVDSRAQRSIVPAGLLFDRRLWPVMDLGAIRSQPELNGGYR